MEQFILGVHSDISGSRLKKYFIEIRVYLQYDKIRMMEGVNRRMTQIKEKAVEMIQRMPDDNMFYVINILENLEAMSTGSREKKERAMAALQNILSFEKRLPVDFDAERELAEAREEKYGHLG